MFEHLLPEHAILLDETVTVPRQELEADEDRIGLVLQQAETVDRAAMDCEEVGVIGLVAGICGLAELFGGIGAKDADLEPRFGEGKLDRCRSRPFGEPLSRAKTGQLLGRGIRIDSGNADVCVLGSVPRGLVLRQAAP